MVVFRPRKRLVFTYLCRFSTYGGSSTTYPVPLLGHPNILGIPLQIFFYSPPMGRNYSSLSKFRLIEVIYAMLNRIFGHSGCRRAHLWWDTGGEKWGIQDRRCKDHHSRGGFRIPRMKPERAGDHSFGQERPQSTKQWELGKGIHLADRPLWLTALVDHRINGKKPEFCNEPDLQ